MVSQRMLQLGTARSVIRELFEYGRQRAAEVGAENVFDFSLGNPSVPAPAEVNDTAIQLLKEQADTIHCYTSAPGRCRRTAADRGFPEPSLWGAVHGGRAVSDRWRSGVSLLRVQWADLPRR